MYFSQPKTLFIRTQSSSNLLNKQNMHSSSKINVFPPKVNKATSHVSTVNFEQFSSKLSKPLKEYSRPSHDILQPSSVVNNSFNVNTQFTKFNGLNNKSFNAHRYSCNIDFDRHSDNLGSTNFGMMSSLDRRTNDPDLESRVKQLQDKMKKNEENIKFFYEQMQHFKHQISSSTSNLLDSINTNILTGSTRQTLKQNLSIQTNQIPSKQNLTKNITQVESITNSPKQAQLQKKLKQIDSIRKQIKKINARQQATISQIKMFDHTTKQILKGFKQQIQQTIMELNRKQQKNNKKLLQNVYNDIGKKIKAVTETQFENIQKNIQEIKSKAQSTWNSLKITKSTQKFTGSPLLIKVREQVFGVAKKTTKLSPFESYEEMIKRNIYEAMGKNPSSTYQGFGNSTKSVQSQIKIPLEQDQTTYYIDEEGYLLDSEGYYLLQQQNKIKLEPGQIEKLKRNHILQQMTSSSYNKEQRFLPYSSLASSENFSISRY